MEIRRKVFSAIEGDEKLYSTTEFDMSYNEAGEKIFSKREDRREAKKAERKKWNYGEHVGSVLTKGGLTTAAVGGGTALAGGGAALGAALKQKERAAIISGTAAHLGAKAARIGLGVAAAGVATKAIAKAARKSKEEAEKKITKQKQFGAIQDYLVNKDKIAAFNYETLGNAAIDHSILGRNGEFKPLEHKKRDLVLEYSNKKIPSFKRSSPSNAMSMDELKGRVRIIVENANSHNKAVLKGRLAPWVIGGGVAAAGTVAATKAIKKKKKDKKK